MSKFYLFKPVTVAQKRRTEFCILFNKNKREKYKTNLIFQIRALQINKNQLMPDNEQQASGFQKFTDFICCSGKAKYPTPYEFQIDTQQLPAKNKIEFESNFVRTSKYTIFSFLPKALFLQFMRLANVYFLVIAILLSIKVISPLDPLTAWTPLIIVIAISMTREGYEDFQRFRSDKKLNNDKANVFRGGKWSNGMIWGNILVGDIVKVQNEQFFPADLILLSSSFPNGSAFIETASLDGEKNYKPRNAFKQTMALREGDIPHIKGAFKGEKPDPDLHHFNCTMVINKISMVIRGDKQLLYRGTKLMNTEYIFGLVVYTGKNTKIMKNSQAKTPEKMSQVENKVNYVLGIVLCIQVFFCLVIAIFYGVFRNQRKDDFYYIDWTPYSSPVDAIIIFFTYFVLINTMIPISLIVSIEMVKLIQKYFIDKDRFMFSDWRNKYAEVKVASLNEQLGQIEYVFSDKTGTLTKNQMEFKIATIGQKMFGDLALIAEKGSNEKPSSEPGFVADDLKDLLRSGAGNIQLKSPLVIKNRQGETKIRFNSLKQVANQYFTAICIAHEVVIEKKDGKENFQGPSPDEVSLVKAAKQMNYEFVESTQSSTTSKILGKLQKFQVLALFPFTSDRKRMSIIVRDHGIIKMYIKGADSIIKDRLSKDNQLNLDQELNRFSVIGLRTLLVAMRVISQKEFEEYKKGLLNLSEKNRQEQVKKLESSLQSELFIIGATAVLDRLQDEVPQTIRDLLRANIKVWMLTGDKMQTAENIAKSCNLIQRQFHILKYKPPKKGQKISKLPSPNRSRVVKSERDFQTTQYIKNEEITLEEYIDSLAKEAESLAKVGIKKALMIQGSDLNTVIYEGKDPNLMAQSDTLQKKLATLGSFCEAVVCCRLLPKQKQDLVGMVRKHLNKITLAIGDGANDVAMIKQAHIGIGLHGQEGAGATQAADYTLGEFRMLWRLLFVHGRWNYMRISEMILYFFYKNMLFTIPQFLNGFFCGYSGQTIYDDVYVTLYNLIFTAGPLIVRAALEQDVNYIFHQNPQNKYAPQFPQVSGKNMISQMRQLPERFMINKYFYRLFPKIYFIGQENCIFNYRNYFAWLVEGMLEATVITVIFYFILSQKAVNSNGISESYWLVGLTIYSAVIMVVTFKLATHTRFWSILLFITIIFLSLGFYIVYMWISNYALSDYVKGTALIAWTSIETYFVVLLCVCGILFVDGLVVFMDFRKGSYASKMRKIVKQEQINNRSYYDEVSLTITSGLTMSEQNG